MVTLSQANLNFISYYINFDFKNVKFRIIKDLVEECSLINS